MALSLSVIAQDVTAAASWRSLRWTSSIGQPDALEAELSAFAGDDGLTAHVLALTANPHNHFYAVVRDGDDVLFSGLVRSLRQRKHGRGATAWGLSATGWAALLALRKVGAPDGSVWAVDDSADGLPTSVPVDPRAQGVTSAAQLVADYMGYPYPDTTAYVDPDLRPDDGIDLEGTDLEGALDELAAASSASALWWLANDAPGEGNLSAPRLALHWAQVVLPDEGDDGDDLLAGLPSGDQPSDAAPWALDNDAPDWEESIMPATLEAAWDHGERRDGAYVRGATGFSQRIADAPGGGWAVAGEDSGGTGWVGSPGGVWGEDYADAPAAVTPEQRDAYGAAWLASRQAARLTVTATVSDGHGGWRVGQAVRVTDPDLGLHGRWLLLRSVSMSANEPLGIAPTWTLTMGDALSPSLGRALRQQRLREERRTRAPATRFVTQVGDLLLDAGASAPVTVQLAADDGGARAVAGVPIAWRLTVNGGPEPDLDGGALFTLTDRSGETDAGGRGYATLTATDAASAADAAWPWAAMAVPQ